MAKKVSKVIKLQVRGGQANPAPPIGPALGAAGVNIVAFTQQFNARTQDKNGQLLPVVITVFADKSFEFIVKTPAAAVQLLQAAQKEKGSSEPNRIQVGSVTWEQIGAIARDKMPDLNAFTLDSAVKMIAGTARSMGLRITGSPRSKSE
ncbi:MAG: 50S ribosomal protein L11 [Flavobacteriales bacterium]